MSTLLELEAKILTECSARMYILKIFLLHYQFKSDDHVKWGEYQIGECCKVDGISIKRNNTFQLKFFLLL